MSLFLRYQTTVQREFDKAITEFQKAETEREKQLLEEAVLQAARERQVPQKTITAAVSGFASQPAAEPDGYFTTECIRAAGGGRNAPAGGYGHRSLHATQ